MLVLSRRLDERLIFPSVPATLQVVAVQSSAVRLGITAPSDVPVVREEICQRQARTRRPRRVRVSAPTRQGHSLRHHVHQLRLGLTLLASQPPPAPAAQAMLEAMNQELALLREELEALLGEEPLPEPFVVEGGAAGI